ncbi:slr1658 superfamily regulator [Leptospira ilyithenensis]|uniref:ATP-binding protein n=1 Tax=Leptospira ilyithenensis TaxID=2484901 RepID=A0A4R9LJV4_9LEPT|nr:ATP-binding protein [Leptospira ilyithenensis]TGN07123.1 ATP-binding protein [Leptospira ilyithenensis]
MSIVSLSGKNAAEENPSKEKITSVISSNGDIFLSAENLPYHSHLSLSVYAQDMTFHWKRCEIVSNFVSQFYSGSGKDESLDTNSASTIMNELIENAAKYSEKENSKIYIEIKDLGNTLRVDVKNKVSSWTKQNFEKLMQTIVSGNVNQMYFDALESKQTEDKTSGIGLLMLLNDYHLNLGYRIKSTHQGSFEITVRVHILKETLY